MRSYRSKIPNPKSQGAYFLGFGIWVLGFEFHQPTTLPSNPATQQPSNPATQRPSHPATQLLGHRASGALFSGALGRLPIIQSWQVATAGDLIRGLPFGRLDVDVEAGDVFRWRGVRYLLLPLSLGHGHRPEREVTASAERFKQPFPPGPNAVRSHWASLASLRQLSSSAGLRPIRSGIEGVDNNTTHDVTLAQTSHHLRFYRAGVYEHESRAGRAGRSLRDCPLELSTRCRLRRSPLLSNTATPFRNPSQFHRHVEIVTQGRLLFIDRGDPVHGGAFQTFGLFDKVPRGGAGVRVKF
jgi:hypothetical protein